MERTVNYQIIKWNMHQIHDVLRGHEHGIIDMVYHYSGRLRRPGDCSALRNHHPTGFYEPSSAGRETAHYIDTAIEPTTDKLTSLKYTPEIYGF